MSLVEFPLERRMSFQAQLHREAMARRKRLWFSGQKAAPVPPTVVIHNYPHTRLDQKHCYIPSAFTGRTHISKQEKTKLPEPPMIDDQTHWPVTIRDIARAASRVFLVSMVDLVSKRRSAKIVRPRQIIFYLAREMTTRSLPDIGHLMGGKDHTTVLHAHRKLATWRRTDEQLDIEIKTVREEALNGRRPRPAKQPITG
jgi:hypothetical protein